MGGTAVTVDGISLTVEDEQEVSQNVVPSSRVPAASGSGRSRLYGGICPLHGVSLDGAPCRKFAHLPGSGRGPVQPKFFRIIRNIVRALVKPLVIFAILGVGVFGGIHFSSGVFDNFVPTGIDGIPAAPAAGSGIPGEDRGNRDNGIQPDCFQSGNPCGLVVPQG